MVFDQQKQFFVRRIEFSGNTTTRDKVIRRELLLDEGQVFNNRLWELSILRLNQLGYFDTIKPENAELKRNVKAGTVDINLKVKEKGKQSISFSGGVSGIAGSFVGLSYQTNNFLGLGETLTLLGAVRRHSAEHHVRLHRAVSFRPAAFDRIHHFREPLRLQHGPPGRAVAGPAGGHQSRAAGKLQHRFEGLHDFRELSAAEAFLHAPRAHLRMEHRRISSRSASRQRLLFEQTKFTSLAGPIGAERHPLEQDYADDHLQHRRQPGEPDARQELLLRTQLRGRAAAGERQHDQQHLFDDLFPSHLPQAKHHRAEVPGGA